jgi:6-phosphogluconolactonase (cycloisomerase 2 family)
MLSRVRSCKVTNGGGAVSTVAITTVSVTCELALPRFAYVSNLLDDTVSMYRIDNETGHLQHRGYAIAGKGPRSVTIDPSYRFA